MYNQKQKSNVHLRKKHKTADRKGGGGSTLTVTLPVRYPGFFYDFPKLIQGIKKVLIKTNYQQLCWNCLNIFTLSLIVDVDCW